MNSDRLARIEEIYHAVLELPLEQRSDFLKETCECDDELLKEVESLLPFSNAASNLIDTPPIDIAAELIYEQADLDIVGTTIDHYRILSKIGSGGMGDVFLAEDTRLERKVAIKFIRAEFAEHAEQLRRFVQEAKMASSLNHPNIITVHEIGKADGIQFIATEYIDGVTLRQSLHDDRLSFGSMLDISIQVATALNAAHKAGIFHRDIKPENIMLRSDQLVKVLDFGLAKLAKSPPAAVTKGRQTMGETMNAGAADMHLTSPGLVMGTAAYMSPEQAQMRAADARTDVWSLGVVMFEMFTGEKPFRGVTSTEMIASILRNEPAPIGVGVPPDLCRLIEKSLTKAPGDRYQSAGEMLSALLACRNVFRADAEQYPEYKSDETIETSGANASLRSFPSGGTIGRRTGLEPQNISSAEYIVSSVRQHKAFSAGAFAVILAVLVVTGYFVKAGYSQPISSIAIMPFVNESGDPNNEYLSDGISESLINELSKMPSVTVTARSSAFEYKGKRIDPEQVARELGVQAVLTGRVKRQGDTLQVSTELMNVRDRSQIWGDRFDRRPADMQQVQDEILRQIVAKLGLRLSTAEQTKLDESSNVDAQAYELFLKGSFYRSIGSEDGAKKAVDFYQQAIAIDPNYAEAYAAMARTYLFLGGNGFEDQREMAAKAGTAAKRALELDDSNPEVHLAMAGIKKAAYDWAGADLEFKRAAELNPNLAAVHFSYSFFLVTQGRSEEAIVEAKRSRELDPLRRNINLDMGIIYYFARQYDLALEQYNTGAELRPDNGPAFYGRGFTYAALGRHEEALADYKEMQRLSGDFTGLSCYIGVSQVKAGRIDEARATLNALETGKKYVSPVELAILYTALGENDKALTSLERGSAEQDSQIQYLGVEPNFDTLHNEPRFVALMQSVGLPH